MTLDEINLPIFIAAFNLAYNRYQEYVQPYDERMAYLKKETNLVYHMMIETMISVKS